ncbi:OmpP1/FadL family transporter [Croceicoccus mobilis]|uniref:Long-chain fatty acid transporter n=1 Tax=Croceicoccus mobilis TaxID=1703339 RepID=A0A916Z629_9SPHN|nr:porin [Croceicoccus mobilis]GGD75858.1 long-chain fatty acid transporter [Croceicoccus mobilis]
MHHGLKNFVAISALAAGIGLPTAAHAGGFYLQEQSVRGAGRAFSGEVADTGAPSLWWNPAAIGGLDEIEGHFAISAIRPKGDIENINTLIVRPAQEPAPVGGQQSSADPIENGVLPSGAIAAPINERLSVGLAVTSPYSFTTNYDADSWVRYTADKTKLRTYDIQPSVAYMITPELSVGAALNIEYADASLSNALPNLSPLLPDGHQELKGNGWDIGWSAGMQYRSGPVTLGAAYKSAIDHDLSGTLTTTGLVAPLDTQNGEIKTNATFSTPWQASVGARVAVTPRLTLNAQAVRFGWSEFDAIRLGDPINAAIPENYRDTWSFAGGFDYAVSPKWTVRGGIQHDQTPTRNDERDARVPDSNRWNFAAGTSYAVSPGFTVDAAFNYIAFKDAPINRTTAAYAGTGAQTPILVDGEVRNASAMVFSLGGRFKF